MRYLIFKKFYKKMWRGADEGDRKVKSKEVKPENVIIKTYSFDKNEKTQLSFNIYYGNNDISKKDVIVDIHGGGWAYGNKDLNDNFCRQLANYGYNVISFSYTLAFKAKLIDQIQEIDMLISYLTKYQEKFCLNMKNLYLTGDSAGGQLILLYTAILKRDDLKKIYSINSTFNIKALALNHATPYIKSLGIIPNNKLASNIFSFGLLKMLLGKNFKKSKYFNNVEPNDILTSSFSPSLIISSSGDKAFSYQSKRLKEDMDQIGIKNKLLFSNNEKAIHVFNVLYPNIEESKEFNKEIISWFKENQ